MSLWLASLITYTAVALPLFLLVLAALATGARSDQIEVQPGPSSRGLLPKEHPATPLTI
jgi:hypothetical protein